jgi:hypothetical protein
VNAPATACSITNARRAFSALMNLCEGFLSLISLISLFHPPDFLNNFKVFQIEIWTKVPANLDESTINRWTKVPSTAGQKYQNIARQIQDFVHEIIYCFCWYFFYLC